ncbi:MAG: S1 family peptidase [Nocardiopsaceae bacterium]|nr:S1 family peptidase [Nocardiopsaceae bacterium]
MRTSARLRVLGGSALALGLVAAGTAVAITVGDSEAETASPTSSHAEDDRPAALRRDLGLTSAQAGELMDQESTARSVDRELRSTLGDAFGGSRFDTESGELTVAVTDEDAADQVREAGAEPRVVTYGEQHLNTVVDQLDDEGATLSEGITGWYPSTTEDAVVITVLEGDKPAAERLAADAGVDSGAVRIEETDHKPELYADIVGGDPYFIDSSGRCSVGFATETGFVTAGHCGSEGTPVTTEDKTGTGTVAGSVFPGSDMAVVQADSNWAPTPAVNDYQGDTIAVAGSEEAPEGASVCRSGSTTGLHCGTIGAKNQTVTYPEGMVQGLTRTDVCAEPGDSGGSWISGDQAQGVTSGGSGDCTSGGTTFFQPINPILEEFGVTLLTN